MLDDINTMESGVVEMGGSEFTLLDNDESQKNIIKTKELDDTFDEIQIKEDGGALDQKNQFDTTLDFDE